MKIGESTKFLFTHCIIICASFICFFGSLSAQNLILHKVNDIETTGIYSGIKQIEPLPNNEIAVSLLTSNYLFGGDLENLSIVNKDTVIQVFEFYQRPYEILFMQYEQNNEKLYALKLNISDDRTDVWLHSVDINRKTHDSLNVPVKYPYREIILDNNYLSFFGSGKSAENDDSLLLEQVYDISISKMIEIWQGYTIIKSFDRGNRTKGKSYYTLSIPTYGSPNPDVTSNYFLVKDSTSFKEIIFNNNNPEQNEVFPFAYTDYNPIFPLQDTLVYVVYEARRNFYYDFSQLNYILVSFNIPECKVNWQYIADPIINYVKPTRRGVHLISDSDTFNSAHYEFINHDGELVYEEIDGGNISYCTANDECFVFRNDTIFLNKFDKTLVYYAFEDLEGYIMNTFHPNDQHHYVTIKKRETNITSIYQLRLDTMVNIIKPTNAIESFELYPNPATNIVNLTLPFYQNYSIKILQLNGTTVAEYTFTGDKLQMDDLSMPIGTYLVKAIGQNKNQYFAKLLWLGN